MRDLATRIEQLRCGEIDELKPAETMSLAREIREAGKAAGLAELRVAFLSSFSFEFAEPYLIVEGARRGLVLRTYYGAFGQFETELADRANELSGFAPDILVLAMRPEDVDPDAVFRYYAATGPRFDELAHELVTRLIGCIGRFRSQSSAPVLVANFATPADLPLGVFDANEEGSLTYALAGANARLRSALSASADGVVWDYAGLVRSQGTRNWTDRRLLALARAPVATRHQPALARHLVRTLRALLFPPAKCLVLDLDNTLWGGAIGDDGLEGIQLGDDHPGVAFKSFQRAVLGLRDRGILLAVASRNDRETVERAFSEHPEMRVGWEDFSAVRIDWRPKSGNLLEIAAELNIGADALALFDDNPVERAEVRVNAPEVRVIEVPSDPLLFETTLAECGEFDAISLTEEDRVRTELYRREGARQRLAAQSGSLDEFLERLEMRATVGRLGASTLQRIGQLLAKTNQFNLTTRRHGRAELETMARDPNCIAAWLRLRDRYGDAGLVAVGILRREGDAAVIDTLLMSCRVMGRGVEQALLAHLADEARTLDCGSLIGDYLPTRKNSVVESLYPEIGFEWHSDLPDGGDRYRLDLRTTSIDPPASIGLAVESEAEAGRGASSP